MQAYNVIKSGMSYFKEWKKDGTPMLTPYIEHAMRFFNKANAWSTMSRMAYNEEGRNKDYSIIKVNTATT